jgi:hypothetical protein
MANPVGPTNRRSRRFSRRRRPGRRRRRRRRIGRRRSSRRLRSWSTGCPPTCAASWTSCSGRNSRRSAATPRPRPPGRPHDARGRPFAGRLRVGPDRPSRGEPLLDDALPGGVSARQPGGHVGADRRAPGRPSGGPCPRNPRPSGRLAPSRVPRLCGGERRVGDPRALAGVDRLAELGSVGRRLLGRLERGGDDGRPPQPRLG